jgi:flagellar motor switch protein FliN/FliY
MAKEAESQEPTKQAENPLAAGADAGATVQVEGNLDFVLEVPLRVTVQIGGARMLVRDVLQLSQGSVVELDRMSGEPADILVNDRLVARGEVTVIDERMAVRVVEVLDGERSHQDNS